MKICRSITKKIPLEPYGGHRYEMMEFWSSYEDELPINHNKEKIDEEYYEECSNTLHQLAKEDIDKAVKEAIKDCQQETYNRLKDKKVMTEAETTKFNTVAKILGKDIRPF